MWGLGEGSQGLTLTPPKVCDLSKSVNLGPFVQKNQSRKACNGGENDDISLCDASAMFVMWRLSKRHLQ